MNEINLAARLAEGLAARLAQGLLAVTIVFVIGLGFQLTILYEGGKFMATHIPLAAVSADSGHGPHNGHEPHNNASRFS